MEVVEEKTRQTLEGQNNKGQIEAAEQKRQTAVDDSQVMGEMSDGTTKDGATAAFKVSLSFVCYFRFLDGDYVPIGQF